MSRAFWGIVYYTLRYGTLIALVVIGADLFAMVLIKSWQGIDTQLLLLASYIASGAIAVVRVTRAMATDS